MRTAAIIILLALTTMVAEAQKPEIRLRGGLNMFNSKSPDKEIAFLPHFGAQAGIRISTIGIYGELQYTMLEDVNTYESLGYLLPSIVGRWYGTRLFYVELGPSLLIPAGKVETTGLLSNPDNTFTFFVGGGFYTGKFEFGLRAYQTPKPTMQMSLGLKF